jgi:hypothetical protein
LSATIVLRPNLDVSAVQAVFKKADGSDFPFDVDLVSYHNIDAKQLVDALCVDAPFDGVFALVDRVCKGMLDGGDGGADLSRDGITKVSQSVYNSLFPVIQESQERIAYSKYVNGLVSTNDTVQALVAAGYDLSVSLRRVSIWEGLKAARNSLRWQIIK